MSLGKRTNQGTKKWKGQHLGSVGPGSRWVWRGNSLGSFSTVCVHRTPGALGKPKV